MMAPASSRAPQPSPPSCRRSMRILHALRNRARFLGANAPMVGRIEDAGHLEPRKGGPAALPVVEQDQALDVTRHAVACHAPTLGTRAARRCLRSMNDDSHQQDDWRNWVLIGLIVSVVVVALYAP